MSIECNVGFHASRVAAESQRLSLLRSTHTPTIYTWTSAPSDKCSGQGAIHPFLCGAWPTWHRPFGASFKSKQLPQGCSTLARPRSFRPVLDSGSPQASDHSVDAFELQPTTVFVCCQEFSARRPLGPFALQISLDWARMTSSSKLTPHCGYHWKKAVLQDHEL